MAANNAAQSLCARFLAAIDDIPNEDRLREWRPEVLSKLLVTAVYAEHAVAKGAAKDFAVDFCAERFHEVLHEINAKVLVGRVASGDNVVQLDSRISSMFRIRDAC